MVFAPQGLQDSARRFNRDASLYGQYFRAKTTGRKGSRIGRINPRFCSPLATDNRQLTTDNCSYLRFFWRPAGRAVVMGRFPALKRRMCLAPVLRPEGPRKLSPRL